MTPFIRAASLLLPFTLLVGCCKESMDTDHHGAMSMESKKVAVAHIRPAGAAATQPSFGSTTGTVTFTQTGPHTVKIVADLTGLPPGAHGIHVHEKADLSSPDLMSAGGHYNPDGGTHIHGGPTTSPMIHAGDLGNITADSSGKAHMELEVHNITIGGHNDILNRPVIIHAKADDLKTQPSGASGARIAGGLIEASKM